MKDNYSTIFYIEKLFEKIDNNNKSDDITQYENIIISYVNLQSTLVQNENGNLLIFLV